jgi:hypothetical protein
VNGYAHEYEEQFAAILDTLEIEYEYEPTTFVIKANAAGEIKTGFTPDFFLPEFNIYVEITAMHGNNCNKKNGKIRAIKELYDIDAILLKKPKINKVFWKFRKGYLTKENFCDTISNHEEVIEQTV